MALRLQPRRQRDQTSAERSATPAALGVDSSRAMMLRAASTASFCVAWCDGARVAFGALTSHPTGSRTTIDRDLVVCFLTDLLTKGERSLTAPGKGEAVLDAAQLPGCDASGLEREADVLDAPAASLLESV